MRTRETSFGDLLADALRAATGADVALTNGGGIRGDATYPAGTEITRKDILTELPFGNVTVLAEVAGTDLLAALENGVSQVEDTAGRFPQVSGLGFTYDPSRPPGARIVEVAVGGSPLNPGRTYRLATNDYLLGGGDGYASLTRGDHRCLGRHAAGLHPDQLRHSTRRRDRPRRRGAHRPTQLNGRPPALTDRLPLPRVARHQPWG